MGDRLLLDLGGTHCRLGLGKGEKFEPDTARVYRNTDFATLSNMLHTYLDDLDRRAIETVCAAVAGPVRGDKAQLTNHSWIVSKDTLSQATGAAEVHLLNDLQAQAYALDDLAPNTAQNLLPGTPDPEGARLVMGLGTGSNIAVAHKFNGRIFVPPAEAGHSTLPDAPEFRALYDAARLEMPHLPIEALLSGPGLTRLHKGLTGQTLSPSDIMALKPETTLRAFVALLGLTCSTLCITHMATGGLYLIGGTARAIAPFLSNMGFSAYFHPRGPYTDILSKTPVHLINDDLAALRGCLRYVS